MKQFNPTERSTVRRGAKRASYDRDEIYAILDEARLCHVAFAADGEPFLIPTIHTRVGDTLYLHGSSKSRMLGHLTAGHRVCISVTLLDGLVLARSALHHSMNYRSVILFGMGRLVEDEKEKWSALEALVDGIVPGRWKEARQPSAPELKATSVVAFPIEEASAKIRRGAPVDDAEDMGLAVWAGVVPVRTVFGEPIPDESGVKGCPLPGYVSDLVG